MSFSIGGLFAEAASLWRRERELIVPVTGVFAFVPLLGFVLMIAAIDLPAKATMPEMMAALRDFQSANVVPLILGNLVMAFGSFAMFCLFLQGGGRTLGEVLVVALKRFLPFLAIDLMLSFAFGLGLALYLLPGLVILARTWLIAPAFAADPEAGPLVAMQRGWRLADGFRWVWLLLAAGVVTVAAVALLVASSLLVALLAAATGMGELIGHVLTAAIGALAWAQLGVLRVAAYRLSSGT